MFTKSIWNAFSEINEYPSLQQAITVDTAIIGGGITGLCTAYELANKGQRVAVFEALKIGGGTTSHSTGNLYAIVDSQLSKIQSKYDKEVLRQVVQSRQLALEKIAHYVEDFGIACDFRRRPFYLYGEDGGAKEVEKELEAYKNAGLLIEEPGTNEIPLPYQKALKLPNQAQFNPMAFVQGFAAAISGRCQLYECSKVGDIKENDGTFTLQVNGHQVTAKHVVHATHTPKGIKLWHTLLGPYREYGVAFKLNALPTAPAIFWGYYDESREMKLSTRFYTQNNEHYVCVIGRPHKVGQKEHNTQSIQELEAFARQHFDVSGVTYRWGGQHYRPADLLPYIGKDGKESESYIATGFSTDGLVWGALSGMMISDLIMGVENPYVDLYAPTRGNILKSLGQFAKENINVATYLVKDHIKLPQGSLETLQPGHGELIELDGDKVAAYKDENGQLHACSALCPHMGCVVHWNMAEKTWDCPCHGSRFKTDGTMLEGPAIDGLKRIDVQE